MSMTYRPDKDSLEIIELLKKRFKIKTTSKLLKHIIFEFEKNEDDILRLKKNNAFLVNKLNGSDRPAELNIK